MNKPTKQVLQTLVFLSSVMLFWVTADATPTSAYDGSNYYKNSGYSYQTRSAYNEQDDSDRKHWRRDDVDNHNKEYDHENSSGSNDNWNSTDKKSQHADRTEHTMRKNHDHSSQYDSDNESRDARGWHYGEKNSDSKSDSSSNPDSNVDKSKVHTTNLTSSPISSSSSVHSESRASAGTTNSRSNSLVDRDNSQSHASDWSYRHEDNSNPRDSRSHTSKSYMSHQYLNDDNEDVRGDDRHTYDPHKNARNDYQGHHRYSDNMIRRSNYQSSHSHGRVHYTSWKKGHHMDQTNSELALTLRSTLQEHAAVVLPALRAEIEQTPDREAALRAVGQNTDAVADVVDMLYADSKDEFADLWQAHIDAYLKAAAAARTSDESAMQEAKDTLRNFTSGAAGWFADQNSEYDVDTLEDMFATHGEQTIGLIERLVDKDYEGVYTSAHEAYVHMGMLADYLAGIRSNDDPVANNHMDDVQSNSHGDMMML